MKGTVSAKKVRNQDKGVAGWNEDNNTFPNEGSLICPPGKSMIFFTKNRKTLSQWPDLLGFGHFEHVFAVVARPPLLTL